MDHTNYTNKINYIRRGIRCHGIDISDTYVIFIRRIRSWTLPKFRNFLEKNFPEFNNTIVAVKHSSLLNDNLYQIKTTASEENINKFIDSFKLIIKKCSINFHRCSRKNHKPSFALIRRKLCHSKKNIKDITDFSEINNSFTSKNNLNEFSFCLSWNTNGWNNKKRDGILYFFSLFKPLFVCFQETGNGTNSSNVIPCKITLPKYKYFCKRANNTIPGLRGLYIFYNRSLQTSIEDFSLNYIISVTTYSLWNFTKCSIGNIYIPQKGHSLHHKSAKAEACTWFSLHLHHPSILLGDFNINLEDIQNWVSNINGWYLFQLNGSPISWVSGSRSSAIDHAIINEPMKNLLSSASIIDFSPISDHKPLLVFGNYFDDNNTFSLPKKPARWNRIKCLDESIKIATSNRFSILMKECTDNYYSSNAIYDMFVSTANSIADELEIVSTPDIHESMFHMSQKIFNLQKLKVKAYKDIKKLGSVRALDDYIRLINNYQKLCDNIHKMCNHFRMLEYQHWVSVGCQLAINKDSRNWWKWIKKNTKIGKSSNFSLHPIKDNDDNIVYSSREQLNVWHDHYEKLASDSTGHSLYKPFWSNPANHKLYNFSNNIEWDINGEISIEEIRSAISDIPKFKASGPDDVPIEFFKAISTDLGNSDDSSDITNYGLSFLHLFYNRIWDGDFPDLWNTACIVSIPKKGDLYDCNNYRGISLINNCIKIISKIVTTRISTYAYKNNFIRPEQFGFRNKEECISLFVSIRTICQTRQNMGKDTYLAFLDLKKAYDSVPIYNILNKLECLGIRGKCYNFLKNLYLSSKACVKLDSQYSDTFNIEKGVRQGCPLSPILFNLFINDIFRDCNEYGVCIDNEYCCGGLFADDIVLCAPTRSKLNKLLKKVNDWAKFNLMEFGIGKCGTTVVKAENSKVKGDPTFYLAGQIIPKTNCYTYLGIPFDSDLSLKPIIKSTNNKVRKALFSVRGFLINPYMPISFKKSVFNSVVVSQVSYVAPLLGSNKTRTNGAQRLINKGLSWIAGLRKRSSFISLYSVSKDLNIPPLSAKCAIAQDKCFKRWADSNCIISKLVTIIPKMRKYTWAKESRTLSKKLSKIGSREDILTFYWNRDVKKDSVKAVTYCDNHLELSRDYLHLELEYPNLAYGFNWLLKIRSGYKFNSEIAKAAKLVSDSCPDYCPCCKGGSQTFEHWILECPTFDHWRSKLFGNLETIYLYVNRKPLVSSDNINFSNNFNNNYNNNIYDNIYNNNSSSNSNININSNNNGNSNDNSNINNVSNSNSTSLSTYFLYNYSQFINNLTINNIFFGFNYFNNFSSLENSSRNSTFLVSNSFIHYVSLTYNLNNTFSYSINNNNNSLNNSINYNNLVSNASSGVNFHSNSLEWSRVYYFLLGGRVNHYNLGKEEWNSLCKAQLKPSTFSDVPLLVRTSALLLRIMPTVSGQIWSLFNRYPNNLTKSVEADNSVGQDSRSHASNNDNNFPT